MPFCGEPLPKNATIGSLVPDSTLSWVVAYAGPCNDPHCTREREGEHTHSKLYLIPMIGWLQTFMPHENAQDENDGDVQYRPAVMSSNGSVVDYLDLGDTFQLIAVLRATDDIAQHALAMFHEKFGKERELLIDRRTSEPVN